MKNKCDLINTGEDSPHLSQVMCTYTNVPRRAIQMKKRAAEKEAGSKYRLTSDWVY